MGLSIVAAPSLVRAQALAIETWEGDIGEQGGRVATAAELCSVAPERPECATPRTGVLSGWFLGLDLGKVTLRQTASDRSGVSGRFMGEVRLGFALLDHISLGIALGGFTFRDDAPFEEEVFECREEFGVIVSCDDERHSEKSMVTGSGLAEVELGLQHRFRPNGWMSLLPGAAIGHLAGFSGLKRIIPACDDCTKRSVDLHLSGHYVVPSFFLTLTREGSFAFGVRSRWFWTGDIRHVTTFAFEVGLP